MTPAPYLVLDYDPWSGGCPMGVAPYPTYAEARAAAESVAQWVGDQKGREG